MFSKDACWRQLVDGDNKCRNLDSGLLTTIILPSLEPGLHTSPKDRKHMLANMYPDMGRSLYRYNDHKY